MTRCGSGQLGWAVPAGRWLGVLRQQGLQRPPGAAHAYTGLFLLLPRPCLQLCLHVTFSVGQGTKASAKLEQDLLNCQGELAVVNNRCGASLKLCTLL